MQECKGICVGTGIHSLIDRSMPLNAYQMVSIKIRDVEIWRMSQHEQCYLGAPDGLAWKMAVNKVRRLCEMFLFFPLGSFVRTKKHDTCYTCIMFTSMSF